MKRDNRRPYLKLWLKHLKGKQELDPKTLFPFLEKKLAGAYSSRTLKRYNATLLANLYENGYLAGKKGKTFTKDPLQITREISLPILDRCLTRDFSKMKFEESELTASKLAGPKTRPARRTAPIGKKGKPKSASVKTTKGKKARGRKKASPGRTVSPKGKIPGLVGRKSDLLRMGQGSFLYAQQLSHQIDELERQVAGYQRVFDALQRLFSREMEELEEWMIRLLK